MEILKFLEKITPKQKKIIAVSALVALVLIGWLALRPKTVAQPVDLSDFGQLPPYGVQDLGSWGQGEVRLEDEPLEMDGYCIFMYKLDTDVLEEYIAMLEQNGFTLVGEHHQSSFLGSYHSYGLICDAASDVETRDLMYTDTPCHVSIWKADRKWRVEICDGLTMLDLGLRRDGTTATVLPQGESVGAGLRRNASGTYKTTDGRLKTKVDAAVVLCDGEKTNCAATWEKSRGRVTVTLEITDDLTAQITYLAEEVEPGGVLLLGQVDHNTATFTLTSGKHKIVAQQTGSACFRNVTLRVMYLEEEGDVVLYLCAQPMDGSTYPEYIEILCAINTAPEEKEESSGSGGGWWNDDDEPFQPNHSKLDCLTCRGDGNCTTCGGDGYTGFGDAKAGCRSCHGNGNCTACGGSGKR